MDALSFDLLELDNKFEADSVIKRAEGDFVRLPLGESVTIVLPVGRKANIMLAGHAFRLNGAKPPSLIDQNGVMYFLKEGRNIIGRHPESDIVIDPDFSDVSRAHVIMEWDGVAGVALVDLSSCGTFVRADALRPRGGRVALASHSLRITLGSSVYACGPARVYGYPAAAPPSHFPFSQRARTPV